MTERTRILVLIGLMSAISVGGVAITIYTLYEAAFQEEKDRLRETVQSRARIIEAVARYDLEVFSRSPSTQDKVSAFETTLGQIQRAHERFKGFGNTGEFTLARREGDKIVFLLSHRHQDREDLTPLDLSSNFAEPMRRALYNQSGTVVGLDYRGETVLAAYEPVAVYGLGIVAKIDLAEVRKPFIQAAVLSLLFVFFFIGLGTLLFLRIGNPIITKLEREVEEHAKARVDLVASEARFRRIFESEMMGVLFWDAQGAITDANNAFLKMVGYSKNDLLNGIDWKKMTPEDHLARDKEILVELTAKGHVRPFEKEYYRKDGSRIPIIIGAATLEDAHDQGVAFILNRTEIKEIEAAKAAVEASLHLMVSEVRDYAIFMLDREGRVASWNAGARAIKGYEAEEIVGQHFSKFYLLEDVEKGKPKRELEIASRTGRYEEEGLRVRKDGSTFFANVILTALRDDSDRVNGFCKVTRDITERKHAEDVLRASESKFRELFANMSSGGAIYEAVDGGKDFVFTAHNRAGETLTGLSRDKVIGRRVTECFPGVGDFGLLCLLEEVYKTGEPCHHPTTMYQDDRISSWFENSVYRLPTGEVVALYEDVTAQRQAEEKIRQSLQEKEVLLREIHHRVKNNLQIVSSLLSLQSRNISDSHAVAALRESRDRINTMAMIHEKLYGTKNLQRIDFGDYVKTFSRSLVQASKISPRVQLEIDITGIELDVQTAIPAGMVVNELLSNSLKHAFVNDRPGKIKISLANHEGLLTLDFSDDGVGLPEGLEPDSTRSLGMRLVHMFVAQLDGGFEHLRGKGTRFRMTFSAAAQGMTDDS